MSPAQGRRASSAYSSWDTSPSQVRGGAAAVSKRCGLVTTTVSAVKCVSCGCSGCMFEHPQRNMPKSWGSSILRAVSFEQAILQGMCFVCISIHCKSRGRGPQVAVAPTRSCAFTRRTVSWVAAVCAFT